jgi:hypothetical protein
MATYSEDSLYIMYIDDRDAGASVIRDPREGMPTECPVKFVGCRFFRPSAVCTVEASPASFDVTIAPEGTDSCAFPHTSQVELTLANLGNQPAEYTATTRTSWLQPAEHSGTVPRDCQITESILYEVGPIPAPGSYRDTIIISYECADGSDTIAVPVTALVECGITAGEYEILSTACWSIGIWNVGRAGLGQSGEEGNMFWLADELPLMYDQGTVISHSGDTTDTWFSLFDGSLSGVGFVGLQPLATAVLTSCVYAAGSWATGDTAVIGFSEYYLPGSPDSCVLIESITICNPDGSQSRAINIGEAVDWNIPDGSGGSANRCGKDETRQMLYQYGPPGGPEADYYGGISFIESIVGAIVLQNDDWVCPNSGFVPAEIGGLMARHSGFEANNPDSLQDLTCFYVIVQDTLLPAGACARYSMVKASSLSGLSDLQTLVDRGWAWAADYMMLPDSVPGETFYYSTDGYIPGEQNDPVNTKWHELRPDYCGSWTATGYCGDGSGLFGQADLIVLENDSSQEEACEYVRRVAPTIRILQWVTADTAYLVYAGSRSRDDIIDNPTGTWWQEIHPEYGRRFFITGWLDNGDEHLGSSDCLSLRGLSPSSVLLWRVDEIATGMTTDSFIMADANESGAEDIDDVVYVIAYIFGGGPAPCPHATASADANCSCAVDVDDVVYLIEYIFIGGAAPCPCEEWVTTCAGLCG